MSTDFVAAEPTPEERRAILRARALALARVPTPAAVDDTLDVLQFHLGSETYGIESAFVREVYPLKAFTPLPGVKSFVLGIVNVRGQILSVVDLKKLFNLPGRGLGELNKVIILRDDLMEFGILADVILGATRLPRSAIQPPIPTVTGIGAEYLLGVTGDGVTVLDAHRLLQDPKIVVNDEKQ